MTYITLFIWSLLVALLYEMSRFDISNCMVFSLSYDVYTIYSVYDNNYDNNDIKGDDSNSNV